MTAETEETPARYWSVDFGTAECGTCGYTPEGLTVEQDEEDSLRFDVTLSVGCYGGDSQQGLLASEAAAFVRELGSRYDRDLESVAKELVELAAEGSED